MQKIQDSINQAAQDAAESFAIFSALGSTTSDQEMQIMMTQNQSKYNKYIENKFKTYNQPIDAVIFCYSQDLQTSVESCILLLHQIKSKHLNKRILMSTNLEDYIQHHKQATESGCKQIISIAATHGDLQGNYTMRDKNNNTNSKVSANELFESINQSIPLSKNVHITYVNSSCHGDQIIKKLLPLNRPRGLVVTFAENGQPVLSESFEQCCNAMLTQIIKDASYAQCMLGLLANKPYDIGATIFGDKPDKMVKIDHNAAVITSQDLKWLQNLMKEGIIPNSLQPNLNFIEQKLKHSQSNSFKFLTNAFNGLNVKRHIISSHLYEDLWTYLPIRSMLLNEQDVKISPQILKIIYLKNLYLIFDNLWNDKFTNMYLKSKQRGLDEFFSSKTTTHILEDAAMWDQNFSYLFRRESKKKYLAIMHANLIFKEHIIKILHQEIMKPDDILLIFNKSLMHEPLNKKLINQMSLIGLEYLNKNLDFGYNPYREAYLNALLMNDNFSITRNDSLSNVHKELCKVVLVSTIKKYITRLDEILENGLPTPEQTKAYDMLLDIMIKNDQRLPGLLLRFINDLAGVGIKSSSPQNQFVANLVGSKFKKFTQMPELLCKFYITLSNSGCDIAEPLIQATHALVQKMCNNSKAKNFHQLLDTLKQALMSNVKKELAQECCISLCDAVLKSEGFSLETNIQHLNLSALGMEKIERLYQLCTNPDDKTISLIKLLMEMHGIECSNIFSKQQNTTQQCPKAQHNHQSNHVLQQN